MSNSSIWPIDSTLSDATTPGQSGPGSDGKKKVTLHSPKLQHYWSLTIRLLCVTSRILVARVLLLCRDAVGVFCNASWLSPWVSGIWHKTIWGIWSTPSVPLFPGPLRPRVIAPDRVLLMGQIKLFDIQIESKQISYIKLNC